MLSVKDLKLFYDTRDLINFDISLGEGICIDGEPGSGKNKVI